MVREEVLPGGVIALIFGAIEPIIWDVAFCGTILRRNRETRELQSGRDPETRRKKSAGLYNFRYSGQSELMSGNVKSLKRLVDVAGIEPATPCLQSMGMSKI
jgi:hypothetical protein